MAESTDARSLRLRPASGSPVQVPGVLVPFLERATTAIAGTRDAHGIPHVHRISSWRLSADRRVMTCSVGRSFEPHLVESLQDNGWFTVTIEEIGPHETYQFKGRYLEHGPSDDEDREAHERLTERFTRVVTSHFDMSEDACRAHHEEPSLAVRFEILEIYVQTPGPGAGRRLVPPENVS